MLPPLITRWLLAGLFLGLLAASRLPAGAARAAGKWPRAGLDFVVLPAADPLRRICSRIPGIAPLMPQDALADADARAQLAMALRENDLLKAQLRAERAAVAWFDQIRAFVKLDEVTPVSAGVAAWTGGLERPLLTLASGSESGLAPRQVVVGAGAELVGVVEDGVGPYACRVRALSWPKTPLDCRIVPAGHEGDGIPVRLRANDAGTGFECDVDIDMPVKAGDVAILDDPGFGGHARGFVVGRVAECLDLRQASHVSAFDKPATTADNRAAEAKMAKDMAKAMFYKRLIVRGANDLARLDRVIVLVPRAAAVTAGPAAAAQPATPPAATPGTKPESAKEPAP